MFEIFSKPLGIFSVFGGHLTFLKVRPYENYGLAVSLADESAKKLFIKSNHFKTESWFENLIWNSFAKANATDSKQPMFHA